jgi:serine/threonine protein kinase
MQAPGTGTLRPVDVAKPTVRVIGRYALYDVLASGGMATVHIGRLLGPVGFSRTVAIKRLHPRYAGDPEFVSMFLEEARLVARIRHPHVVPMLDVVATAGELFLVMEYVAGESLARLAHAAAERGERVPLRVSVAILSGLLQGLHAAHEAHDEHGQPLGIVHRDVSPQNVLVGSDGQARVLDFGIAKAAGRVQTTADGQVKGKLSYMAPEQLRGGEVTRKVDIYAASVVLWELLAGQRLFQGENEGATLTKILLEDIMPPSVAAEKKGNLPEGSDTMKGLERLDAITMRGLQRDQGKRFDTAREMAHALEGCIPPATASEVSAWIERVASPALMRRAEEVTAIESGSFTNPRTTLDSISRNSQASRKTSDPSVAPRRGGRRRVVTAGLVGLALASITVALALHARPPASATSVVASTQPVPPPSAIPPPAPSAVTVDSTPPAPTLSASPTSSAEAPSHSLSSTKHVKPARPRPPPGCDPPYTWDDEGRKHYKPECL